MKSKLRTYLYKPIYLVFVFASNSVECDSSKRKADLASSEVSTALIDLAFEVHLVFMVLLVFQLHQVFLAAARAFGRLNARRPSRFSQLNFFSEYWEGRLPSHPLPSIRPCILCRNDLVTFPKYDGATKWDIFRNYQNDGRQTQGRCEAFLLGGEKYKICQLKMTILPKKNFLENSTSIFIPKLQ